MANAPAVTDKELRMSYRIGRGETGVLSFEPYKSYLLPKWRFRTPELARESSQALYRQFLVYQDKGDFVGMDSVRKFIQMGMTRAKRYANYKGGKKYSRDSGNKVQNNKTDDHEGATEKLEASRIFREVWQLCRGPEYQAMKAEFVKEQKAWEKMQRQG